NPGRNEFVESFLTAQGPGEERIRRGIGHGAGEKETFCPVRSRWNARIGCFSVGVRHAQMRAREWLVIDEFRRLLCSRSNDALTFESDGKLSVQVLCDGVRQSAWKCNLDAECR